MVTRGLSRRQLCLLAAGVLAATSAPYAYRWAVAPPGSVPLGNDFVNLGDLYAYVSWIEQAVQGHALFVNLYCGDPQPRVFLLPLFLVLGRVAAATGLSALAVYHLARVVGSALLLPAAWWLCGLLVPREPTRSIAFLMLVLATGLPGLVPEASPISSMFDSALLTWGWLLLLLGAGCWRRACATIDLRWSAATGMAVAALLLIHPYEAVTLLALVVATAAWLLATTSARAGIVRSTAVVLAVASPAAMLLAGGLAANPTLADWAAVERPTHGWELASFGSIALLAAWRAARRPRPDPFLLLWAASELLLVLAPFPNQRRYILGLQAPLAVLAAEGFEMLRAAGWRRAASYLMIAAFPASGVMLLVDLTNIVEVPRYFALGTRQTLAELATLPPGVILAPPGIDYLVPALAGRQVYAGHHDLTPDYARRSRAYPDFEAGRIDARELARLGIRYLLIDHVVDRPRLTELRHESGLLLYEVAAP